MAQETNKIGKFLVVLFFCFIASFLGSWVFLSTGLVSTKQITTQNTKVITADEQITSEVAEKVSPSVVSVITTQVTTSGYFQTSSQAAGTGIVISKDGYILTNKHVVSGATKVSVVMDDGTLYRDVELVGVDPLNDIAFLKMTDKPDDLKPAVLGDSSRLRIGQKVLAIGNALGEYQNSVTSGIISGKGRPIIADDGTSEGESLDNLLQTDAAINQGNSGGPLVDLDGRIIGVNTAIAADSQGVGFAIPINATKGMVRGLFDTGKVERAYLGVTYIAITPVVADELGTSVTKGVYVYAENGASVAQGSPASKAGIRNGDIIVSVNSENVDQNNGLSLLLAQYTPGDTVTLELLSQSRKKMVEVTLGTYTGR